MEWFDFGDLVRVATVFADSTNTALDPTVVKFQYRADALGVTSVLTYGADAALGRSAVGHYFVDLDTNQSSGKWTWRFYSTGVGQAAEEDVFYVRPSVASLANQIPAGIDPSTLILPSYAEAGLPTNAVAGQLARVTDGIRGVWFYNGTEWLSITGHIDIRDFGAKGDGVTNDSPAIQAAFDAGEGERIFAPSAQPSQYYKIGTPINLNIQNFIFEGASRIYTDFRPGAADISVGGGPNAMFINRHANSNVIFRGLRFLSGGATYNGYVFSAVDGGVGAQEAFISVTFDDCWAAMGYASAGFLNGGMVDSWVRNCQFELMNNVFVLQGAGISGNFFIGNRLNAMSGGYIISTANSSNVNQVSGVIAEAHIGGTLFQITGGANWDIDQAHLEYNAAVGVDGGFANFINSTGIKLTNFKAERLGGDMAGILIDDTQIQLAHGVIDGAIDPAATPGTIHIKDAVDVDMTDVRLEDDAQAQVIFEAASGSVRIRDLKTNRGALKILATVGGASSADISVANSELLNGEYGGGTTNTVSLVDLATSGTVSLKSNRIGTNHASSNPLAIFRFTGSGLVVADDNDLVGAEPVFQSGSTQEFRGDSGTYTPVLTNGANVAVSAALPCQWARSGKTVTVSGQITVDPTTTVTLTVIGMSLPIASNFAQVYECAGVAMCHSVAESAQILADVANNLASMTWFPTDVASRTWSFTYTYQII